MEHIIKPIAHIESNFPTKFGIPRQSGLTNSLTARIVFEKEFRNADTLRGLDSFSHIWLIWGFSENLDKGWSPTVRPPRLGGNQRMGVFATRSPFRPNGLGLSSVRLDSIEMDADKGPVLMVSGADLMNGTPIFDVKPYISMDSHPDALCGFQEHTRSNRLQVKFPASLLASVPENLQEGLMDILSQDPRPSYQNNPKRIYGVPFAGMDIRFFVADDLLTVVEVVPL